MKIGFTGTQIGMTDKQKEKFFNLLYELKCTEFRHGDCVGADTDAHNLMVKYFKENLNNFIGKIIIHPPIKDAKRSFCRAKTILPPKDYLDRNHDIVDESDLLIATPKEKIEQLRSGTWATIRYAAKQNKKILLIYPDGTIKETCPECNGEGGIDSGGTTPWGSKIMVECPSCKRNKI